MQFIRAFILTIVLGQSLLICASVWRSHGILASVIAGIASLLVTWGLLHLLLKGLEYFSRCSPSRPRCANGKCGSDDYEFEVSGQIVYCKCQCGIRYVRTGKRFMIIGSDGERRRFAVKRLLGPWKLDKQHR